MMCLVLYMIRGWAFEIYIEAAMKVYPPFFFWSNQENISIQEFVLKTTKSDVVEKTKTV